MTKKAPLVKGMRVRLTAQGLEHISFGRQMGGVVWRKPRSEKAVCVLEDGHKTPNMYYSGFWEEAP